MVRASNQRRFPIGAVVDRKTALLESLDHKRGDLLIIFDHQHPHSNWSSEDRPTKGKHNEFSEEFTIENQTPSPRSNPQARETRGGYPVLATFALGHSNVVAHTMTPYPKQNVRSLIFPLNSTASSALRICL